MNLTNKEMTIVHEFALREFDNRPKFHAEHMFLTECVVKAFVNFLNSKGLVIVPVDVLKK